METCRVIEKGKHQPAVFRGDYQHSTNGYLDKYYIHVSVWRKTFHRCCHFTRLPPYRMCMYSSSCSKGKILKQSLPFPFSTDRACMNLAAAKAEIQSDLSSCYFFTIYERKGFSNKIMHPTSPFPFQYYSSTTDISHFHIVFTCSGI